MPSLHAPLLPGSTGRSCGHQLISIYIYTHGQPLGIAIQQLVQLWSQRLSIRKVPGIYFYGFDTPNPTKKKKSEKRKNLLSCTHMYTLFLTTCGVNGRISRISGLASLHLHTSGCFRTSGQSATRGREKMALLSSLPFLVRNWSGHQGPGRGVSARRCGQGERRAHHGWSGRLVEPG